MTDIDTVSNKILEHRECQQKFKNKKEENGEKYGKIRKEAGKRGMGRIIRQAVLCLLILIMC